MRTSLSRNLNVSRWKVYSALIASAVVIVVVGELIPREDHGMFGALVLLPALLLVGILVATRNPVERSCVPVPRLKPVHSSTGSNRTIPPHSRAKYASTRKCPPKPRTRRIAFCISSR
jgi:hypothetical protein